MSTSGGTSGGAAALLGYCCYQPVVPVAYTYDMETLVAIDSTNLTVTFTAPASGKALVQLAGVGGYSSVSADNCWWGLVTHGTSTQVGPLYGILNNGNLNGDTAFAASQVALVTGLTPGASVSLDWAWVQQGPGSILLNVAGQTSVPGSVGVVYGPASMLVFPG